MPHKTTRSWVREGKRINKMKGRASRWGPGKVHVVVYDPVRKLYEKACRRLSDLEAILGGEMGTGNVPRKKPLTCRKCQKIYPDL